MGWYGKPFIKNKVEFMNYIVKKFSEAKIKVVDTCMRDEHFWVLHKYGKDTIADVFLIKEEGQFLYKPLSSTEHPFYYDVPKEWKSHLTKPEDLSFESELYNEWYKITFSNKNEKDTDYEI